MLMHLPIVIAAALPLSPIADKVLKLDVVRECRVEADDQAGRLRCTEEENQALQQIKKQWPTFNSADRRQCGRETEMGGAGSYVEFLTCLEMVRDRRTDQNAQNQSKHDQGTPKAPE